MSSLPAPSYEGSSYPQFATYLPTEVVQVGKYELRFARSREEVDAIQRLRFNVFNLELQEGLDVSYETGKDEDTFDEVCHHMMIIDKKEGVVGTYRLQTREMAEQGGLGFYSATEYDFSMLPDDVLDLGVELGRACIAKNHRSLRVLYLLWRGIGVYLTFNKRRYVFGCSSLTSQDPVEGHRVLEYFRETGNVHDSLLVHPLEEYRCDLPEGTVITDAKKAKVPRLLRVYLSLGAKICSPPALDRQFKTIDYLTIFDTEKLTDQAQAYFMPTR